MKYATKYQFDKSPVWLCEENRTEFLYQVKAISNHLWEDRSLDISVLLNEMSLISALKCLRGTYTFFYLLGVLVSQTKTLIS